MLVINKYALFDNNNNNKSCIPSFFFWLLLRADGWMKQQQLFVVACCVYVYIYIFVFMPVLLSFMSVTPHLYYCNRMGKCADFSSVNIKKIETSGNNQCIPR